MRETLEERLRRRAKIDGATLCNVYPGDVIELLDALRARLEAAEKRVEKAESRVVEAEKVIKELMDYIDANGLKDCTCDSEGDWSVGLPPSGRCEWHNAEAWLQYASSAALDTNTMEVSSADLHDNKSICICCDFLNHNPDPIPNPDCPIHGALQHNPTPLDDGKV